jgi:hypothetical protein
MQTMHSIGPLGCPPSDSGHLLDTVGSKSLPGQDRQAAWPSVDVRDWQQGVTADGESCVLTTKNKRGTVWERHGDWECQRARYAGRGGWVVGRLT